MIKFRHILFSIAVVCAFGAEAATISFTGSSQKVISEKAEASTGLNDIYVLYSTQGVTASYKSSGSHVSWLRYSNLGGGYAEAVEPAVNGDVYSISLGDSDMGYIIEDGDKRYYFWVVNYANHHASLDGLIFSNEQDCDRARLALKGNASKINYYTINGQAKELSRDLQIEYYTLAYDQGAEEYVSTRASAKLPSIDGEFGVIAPYCDTEFTISGDRFLKAWGMEQHASSDTYKAIAVDAHTTATQELREVDNEQKAGGDGLGGSAPVDINFHAAVTDAAIFREWQLSRDSEFNEVFDRYQQLDLDYTFREDGTTYVRFFAANSDGSCEAYGDTYEVFIGESVLLCPNAFSPGSSEGVNDEWKVSYKSIISFDCHIFNRWGQEMKHLSHPSQGWDGKYNGKVVPSGVYYYVIQAEGSDGRKYKLSGDINIIKSKPNNQAVGGDE